MIDTHAHLLYYKDVKGIINSMETNGLDCIVTIGTTAKDSKESVELAQKYNKIYATVGIYPEYAENTTDEDIKIIEELANQDKVVAIGEIGLDYHNDGYDAELQKSLFIRQLKIADNAGIPFCIHCRGAVEDVYSILREHKHLINHSGLMHCYSEGREWVQKFLELGLYISFSGNITFKKSDRSFLKEIPLDKILVETDSPYLSPEPFRGRENLPERVNIVAQNIAKELNIDFDEFDKIVSKNAKTFYFKIKNQ